MGGEETKAEAAIFVDRRSINQGLRERGLVMNFEALMNAVKSKFELTRAAVYDYFPSNGEADEKVTRFIHYLERGLGFQVETGGVVTLAADLMAYARAYDVAFLVSLHPVAPRLARSLAQGLGKDVVGVGLSGHASTELKVACTGFCTLEELGATRATAERPSKVVDIKKARPRPAPVGEPIEDGKRGAGCEPAAHPDDKGGYARGL